MELHLKLIGMLLIMLACSHIAFPKYFKWAKELDSLSLINRQLMYIHTFFVALILMLMGLLCFTSAKDLIETGLGKRISFGLSVFWFIRVLIQFFGYSSALWKGKEFETVIHILFSILWCYLTIIFFMIWLQ